MDREDFARSHNEVLVILELSLKGCELGVVYVDVVTVRSVLETY